MGHTSNTMRLPVEDASGRSGEVISTLEWPLDVYTVGTRAMFGASTPLRITAAGALGFDAGNGVMSDSDWFTRRSQDLAIYTESKSRAFAVFGDLQATYRVIEGPAASGSVGLGYRHEYYALDAFGLHGWQRDAEGIIPLTLPSDEPVLHYRLHHALPYLVLLTQAGSGEWSLEGEARAFGVLTYGTDQHAERAKRSSSRSRGLGTLLALSPLWAPWLRGPSLGMRLEWEYLTGLTGAIDQSTGNEGPIPTANYTTSSMRWHFTFVAAIDFPSH